MNMNDTLLLSDGNFTETTRDIMKRDLDIVNS